MNDRIVDISRAIFHACLFKDYLNLYECINYGNGTERYVYLSKV